MRKASGAALVFIIGIVSIVLIALVVLAGWQIGWWFNNQNTNRSNELIHNGYAFQTSLKGDITQNIANVYQINAQVAGASGNEVDALKAQRLAVLNIVCSDAIQVNNSIPLDPSQAQFIAANCSSGTVSPASQYN